MTRKSQWRKNTDWIDWQAIDAQESGFDTRKMKKKLQAVQSKAMLKKARK